MFIKLPQTDEFKALQSAVAILQSRGFAARIAGGAVRDMILGRNPSDLDIVTTALPQEVVSLFPGSKSVGASFGVVLLKHRSFEFETATAREERNYMDGRHPENIRFTTDFAVDSSRRDFTINAMMCDPATGEIFDWHGGISDLKQGIIRTVGEPEERFSEDYLRMLRAVRFAGRYGFEIESRTLDAIRKLSPECADIAGERINAEITGMLLGTDPAGSIALLESTGILRYVLPEIAALRGVAQPPEFHPEGDVLTHTLLMLRHMVMPDKLLAWSVLLHDVGKKAVFSRDETGRIRFFGHETVGAELAEKILARLHFSRHEISVVCNAVRNHMRFAAVNEMRKAKIMRLITEENFPLELELNRLDCISSNMLLGSFVKLLDAVSAMPVNQLPVPLITGDDLIKAGLTPGKFFGRILTRVFDAQLTGEVTDKKTALKMAMALAAGER